MENRYPLFTGGRILKKEALWDMRDYAYGSQQAVYAGYTDGILKGCGVRVKGSQLVIDRGILKCGNFLYQIQEEMRVPFTAENRMVALKVFFSVKAGHPDYLSYQADFRLDYDLERRENQIELCRFHLREGSMLRDAYKDFSDLQTGYDTVNLINATVAGRGKERIHPVVLLRFAEEMQERGGKDAADMAFTYEIWNHAGELERMAVLAYLADRGVAGMEEMRGWGNKKIVSGLEEILLKGRRMTGWEQEKNIIYVE